MIEVFRAGRQLWKVRAIMWLSVPSAALALWSGWVLFQTYGLQPADGGVLAPVEQRIGWLVGLGGLGLAFLLGMWAYGRCYVSRIDYDRGEGRLRVSTVAFLGSRAETYAASEVLRSSFHGGTFDNADGVSVRAPWHFVYMKRRRWPLIVDAQGEFVDARLATRLMKAS